MNGSTTFCLEEEAMNVWKSLSTTTGANCLLYSVWSEIITNMNQLDELLSELTSVNTNDPIQNEKTMPVTTKADDLTCLLDELSVNSNKPLEMQQECQKDDFIPIVAKPLNANPIVQSVENISTCDNRLCSGCGQSVSLRAPSVSTKGRIWHLEHFKCTICFQLLQNKPYYEANGSLYCPKDYTEVFAPRCAYCTEPITERSIKAVGKTWHLNHFFCSQCGCNFTDGHFFEFDGKAYCEKDYKQMFMPKCKRCDKVILADTINAIGVQWHPDCFNCTVLFFLQSRIAPRALRMETFTSAMSYHIVNCIIMPRKS